jgi:plasmid stability protein
MEEEARRILNRAVHQDERQGIGSLIHSRFEAVGGVDLEIPPRSSVRPAPALVDDVP